MNDIYAYCKCEFCGNNLARVSMDEMLTSLPPQYGYKCGDCGRVGTINCSEVSKVQTFEPKEEELICKRCIICGSAININEYVCDECKEAIKYVREQMKKEKIMTLNEFLDLNIVKNCFNIDMSDVKHYCEVEHDFYCSNVKDVKPEYLNYRVAQIYGFDDGLTIVIEKE